MKKMGLLFLIIALALPSAVTAQDDSYPLPACSAADMVLMAATLESVVDDMTAANERMGELATMDELADMINDIDAVHLAWHNDIAPELPECRLAWHVNQLTSRYFSELLIGLLYIHGGFTGMYEPHAHALSEIGLEFLLISSVMEE